MHRAILTSKMPFHAGALYTHWVMWRILPLGVKAAIAEQETVNQAGTRLIARQMICDQNTQEATVDTPALVLYKEATDALYAIRLKHEGAPSHEEDAQLVLLDSLWNSLTDDEKASLNQQ